MTFLHFYLWLPERYDLFLLLNQLPGKWGQIKPIRWLQSSSFLKKFRGDNLIRNRGLVAGWGIPVSMGVGIYTGVLLGALNARPFWNNPMLPFLFLLSAMKTGPAAICFVGCFLGDPGKISKEEMEANKFMIHTIDFTLMVFSIIAVFLFVMGLYVSPRSSVEAAHLIMGGDFTLLFWVIAVGLGILLPMALETYELIPHFIRRISLREHNPWISGITAVSVLFGGFMLRYVVVYAGQIARVIVS
jgi:formate-dependent nitrite reductase membrane component NrfD